jgi:hypothetical protein
MAGSINVHPISDGDDNDTFSFECTFRLKVLDAATGEPVTDAFAEQPTIDIDILNRRGVHPFRVLRARTINFTHSQMADFSFDVHNLRTFVPADDDTEENRSLTSTYVCTEEFIHQAKKPEVLLSADNTTEFHKIHHSDSRYICTKSAGNEYAQRALITNLDGVLEIPIPFTSWLTGSKIKVKLRDHVMLKAEEGYDPQQLKASETSAGKTPSNNGHKALGIELRNNPMDNQWFATGGGAEKQFADEIEFETSPLDWDDIDATVWVVRRAQEASTIVSNDLLPTPSGTYHQNGILIHYNSGYYLSEKRGTATHLCRDAFNANENKYMMMAQMALWILKRINGASGTLGYHYHIDYTGSIYRSRDDTLRANHAGFSREPNAVTARENDVSEPRTVTQTISSPRNSLNRSYVGIDLLGNHRAGYHYTDQQHWYLDRLIENIMSRNSNISWYEILGHDESRAAYKAAHPASAVPDKADPGAALRGGAQSMELLRGRHGATFE